ncbi:acyl-CoA thioesterase [Flocculibacter collagenilyticus]|uniref:acyl-CoA thioesterase n=1 Tax=Flocculibacter collagenilyticus TaxID=2744479 RepID=UPI0018F63587|nr:acyl-CoA thioesterase [Flocculibacter collagenilyticus]
MEKAKLIAVRKERSIVRTTKTVFPGRTNHHNTLFGGEALAWMDEAAFISATRFCRKPLVTISSDKVDFKEAIPSGSIVEIVAKVVEVGNTSIKVQIDIYVENMFKDDQHKAISGEFTFVALDENRKPTSVI